MRVSTRESDVLAACLQYLGMVPEVFAWRNQTAGVRRRDCSGREFWAFAGLKGAADILGVIRPHGKMLAVECKAPGGKMAPAQQLFLDTVKAWGGIGLVVDDVRQLVEAIQREVRR